MRYCSPHCECNNVPISKLIVVLSDINNPDEVTHLLFSDSNFAALNLREDTSKYHAALKPVMELLLMARKDSIP